MRKRDIWILINAFALVAIVYLDMALWTAFGPSSTFQQFPVIFLSIVPVFFIAFSLLRGRLPGKS